MFLSNMTDTSRMLKTSVIVLIMFYSETSFNHYIRMLLK